VTETAEPVAVTVHTDGTMDGHNSHYEKYLRDMADTYQDVAAFEAELASRGGDALVYHVEESRTGRGPGALIAGTSVLQPGRIGDEYSMTRGHLHALPNCAEVYYGVSGQGVMMLDSLDGQYRALPIGPGIVVTVPGGWVHRSVNVGDVPLVTLFVYNEDAGQDYALIGQAGGMSHLIVTDGTGGWKAVPNPRHKGYQRPGN